MFYNQFIATLYHFLGLTHRHSVQCQLLFLLVFYFAENQYQRSRNAAKLFGDFFGPEDIQWAKEVPEGDPRGAQPTWACPGAQARPGGLCPPQWPPVPRLRSINCQIFQNPRG